MFTVESKAVTDVRRVQSSVCCS